MWAKLDDALLDHPKLLAAGATLGDNGIGLALALYAVGLMWSAKHLTDGALPRSTVTTFPHLRRPLVVAKALVAAGLWESNGRGFHIHDFRDFNPSAAEIKEKRRADRERKFRAESTRNPHGIRADSARNPERSRARDPVPVPVPLNTRDRARARVPPRSGIPGTTCHHDPRCRRTADCIARTLAEGRAKAKGKP